MNVFAHEFEDFVLKIDNFFSEEECNLTIDCFENFSSHGFTFGRESTGSVKIEVDDEQLFSDTVINNDSTLSLLGNHPGPYRIFNEKFWDVAYPTYTSKYGIIKKNATHLIRHLKIQKTKMGEGYHAWHSEDSAREVGHRFLTFVLYLNDIEEGGETEFLYYSKRVKPKAGTLILWPAGFTHTHRGNPPLKDTKYIMTGWVEFV